MIATLIAWYIYDAIRYTIIAHALYFYISFWISQHNLMYPKTQTSLLFLKWIMKRNNTHFCHKRRSQENNVMDDPAKLGSSHTLINLVLTNFERTLRLLEILFNFDDFAHMLHMRNAIIQNNNNNRKKWSFKAHLMYVVNILEFVRRYFAGSYLFEKLTLKCMVFLYLDILRFFQFKCFYENKMLRLLK